jgi:lysophospholipase L1-like esterase
VSRPSASKKTGFALVAVLLFFVLLEVGLRVAWAPDFDASKFTHATVYPRDEPNQDGPRLHKELRSNFHVTTDADGLRPPFHEAKEGVRIVTMGCSTTYGWGVDDTETFPYRLQERLTESGKDVQVINGGQPGYTSFQGINLWETVLKQRDPDIVLLGFVVQDARRAAYSDLSQALLMGENTALKGVLWNWTTYRFLQKLLGRWQVEAKECQENEADCPFRVPPEDYLENLRALVGAIEDSGATPVLFGYPLEVAGYTELHRAVLSNLSDADDIPYVDPSDATRNRRDYYFVPDDPGHANAAGNDAIAESVAQFLTAEGLID